jgi:hypothetical protein
MRAAARVTAEPRRCPNVSPTAGCVSRRWNGSNVQRNRLAYKRERQMSTSGVGFRPSTSLSWQPALTREWPQVNYSGSFWMATD